MAKRKMPRKTATLDFTRDGYEGFTCETWLNIPVGLARRYGAVNEDTEDDAADSLFRQLFPSWNFVDFDGKLIPHTAEGADLIPSDLGTAMMARRAEALQNGAMPGPLETESSELPSEEKQE